MSSYTSWELYRLHGEKLWSCSIFESPTEPQEATDKASIRAIILKHLTP